MTDSNARTLSLKLLGQFEARRVDGEVAPLKPRQQALLAWLVLHRGAAQPRARVAGLLWPDSTESQARTNLRNLLFRLRGALPEVNEALVMEGQTLAWADVSTIEVDVAVFERGAAAVEDLEEDAAFASRLRAAVDAFGGTLLPGRHEEWLEPHRARLSQTFVELADELSAYQEKAGDLRGATQTTQRLLRHDPVLEPAHRRLIRLRLGAGDRAGAVRAYHACAEVLRAELGVEPGPATTALYERVSRNDPAPSTPPDPSSTAPLHPRPLIGRDAPLEQLRASWSRACAQGVAMVHIHGDAGVGKTRLAEAAAAWAREQGARVGVARCPEGVGVQALAPVTQWLRGSALVSGRGSLEAEHLVEVARLLPEIRADRPELPAATPIVESWQRTRFVDALAMALDAGGPLVLILDDAQWCDAESLAVVQARLERSGSSPLLLVVTERITDRVEGGPWATAIRALQRRHAPVTIALEPLDALQTRALADALSEATVDETMAARLYEESEGNPLFVVEFVRTGLDPLAEARTLPETVQAVIEGRLASVSRPALEVMRAVCVAGHTVRWEDLELAVEASADEVTDAIDELWRRGFVRERANDGYSASHGRIAEVVRGQISAARRAKIHRRLGEAMQDSQQFDEGHSRVIARHFELAGRKADALAWFRRSADWSFGLFANEDARADLCSAIALLPREDHGGPAHLELQEMWGRTLALSGRNEEAADVFRQGAAFPGLGGLTRGRLLRRLAMAEGVRQRHPEALEACTRAEEALADDAGHRTADYDREWVSVQLARMLSHYWLAEVDAMEAVARRLEPKLDTYGNALDRAKYHVTLLGLDNRRNRYAWNESAESHSEAYMAAARESGDERELGQAYFMLGFTRLHAGQVERAREPLARGLAMSVATGDRWLELRGATYVAMEARRRDARNEVPPLNRRIETLAEALELPSYVAVARANEAWMHARDGEWDHCLRLGREAIELWDSSPLAYPFKWLGLFPVIAAASAGSEVDVTEAGGWAAALLEPTQVWLPEPLVRAARASAEGDREAFAELTRLARDEGFL